MEQQKYYWMSYILRHEKNMSTVDIDYLVTDRHPALEIKDFKAVSPDWTVGILSWKEISLDEYLLWK